VTKAAAVMSVNAPLAKRREAKTTIRSRTGNLMERKEM
jgi:hypothetical protein